MLGFGCSQAECVAAEPGLAESCGGDEARAGQAALCDLAQEALDLAQARL